MPEIARVVDEFRRVFGPDVRVLWARENGIEVGSRDPAAKRGVADER